MDWRTMVSEMMNDEIDADKLHTMIRKFVGYGAPITEDGEGSNKPDWSFFSMVAGQQSIEEHQMKEAAERFHKYRKTQMARLLSDVGLAHMAEDVGHYLETMKKQGEKAIRLQRQQTKAKQAISDAVANWLDENWEGISKKYYYQEFNFPEIDEALKLGITKAEIDKHIEARIKTRIAHHEELIIKKTVTAFEHEDKWTNRWGKQVVTKRIGLRYGYNPTVNNALKNVCKFPEFKWDGSVWSLKNDPQVLQKAKDTLESLDMIVDDSFINFLGDALGQPIQEKVTTVSAHLEKGTSVVLKWPYLADPYNRTRLMDIVKGTDGRKFRVEDKVWVISIAQVGDLTDRLTSFIETEDDITDYTEAKDMAQRLIDAMGEIPEVKTYMEERAKRVAISGASKLSDMDIQTDIEERLAGVFPEHLSLYPFQYVGVRFAELAGGRALIGDDMGIGKTIQAIAYSALHGENWPVLVVCPANVRYNWVKEFQTWIPDVKIEAIKTGKQILTKGLDVAVITYGLVNNQLEQLLEYGFDIVICDESHYLKNVKAQRTIATLEVANQSENVLCLSGTAITNRPNEFFTTLNLLRPSEFPSFYPFGQRYCDPVEVYTGRGNYATKYDGASNTKELHNRIRDFCIRRLKKEVLTELPNKVRSIHTIEPSALERRKYQNVHDSWCEEYAAHQASGRIPKGFVLNMLTDLRHECGKMKINATIEWMEEYWFQNPDKPLVVFTHHRDVMKSLEEAFSASKEKKNSTIPKHFKGCSISGETSADMRGKIVEAFQKGEIQLLIASTIAAKEGLTLTAADTVVFVEREWVPGWEEQAEDRVNHIGQDSDTVWATYLSVKGTIDEKFDAVVEAKREVVKAILDGGDIDEREGIASALIKSMVEAGDLPETFLDKPKKQKPKEVKE